MTDPTPAQRAELAETQESTRRDLDALIGAHACNRLNGGHQVDTTALLFGKLAQGTPGALALLLAEAIDRLAEQSWTAS
jgi:hypothetical protein